MQHLILGAGPAGVIAAETLRQHAPHDSIVLLGDEPEAPYSRMAIPYLLAGHIGEEGTRLRRTSDHFERLRIELKRGRAVQLDGAARTVTLEDGERIGFDKLLIATGSSPAAPPIPGLAGAGVHSCWTLADARAIAALARPGARVVQMGAGFIGCILLEALVARGAELTVVEAGPRMVPRMMGPTAGGMIQAWCESKGVRVLTGTRVESIARGGTAPMRVCLGGGAELEADLLINATGVKPNIGFLQGSGVRCLVGVLTDAQLQTSAAGIYAAGDCAEAFDKVSGQTIVSAIQPNAAEQARVAALNMAGQAATLPGVTQINVLDTLGLVSCSFGNWQGVPEGHGVELTDARAWRHLGLQFGGGRLVGCNAVGWTEHVGVMRGLVEGQVALGEWEERLLRDPTCLVNAYLACAQGQDRHAHARA